MGNYVHLRPWNREFFHHFHVVHNTPRSLIPKILRNHCFRFLLGIEINEVYYVKMVNTKPKPRQGAKNYYLSSDEHQPKL